MRTDFSPPSQCREDLLEAVNASIRRRIGQNVYVTPPPQAAWPRIFPQL
jgi:hypothetical protein